MANNFQINAALPEEFTTKKLFCCWNFHYFSLILLEFFWCHINYLNQNCWNSFFIKLLLQEKIGNHDSLTPWSTFSFTMTSALTGSTYLRKRFHKEKFNRPMIGPINRFCWYKTEESRNSFITSFLMFLGFLWLHNELIDLFRLIHKI